MSHHTPSMQPFWVCQGPMHKHLARVSSIDVSSSSSMSPNTSPTQRDAHRWYCGSGRGTVT